MSTAYASPAYKVTGTATVNATPIPALVVFSRVLPPPVGSPYTAPLTVSGLVTAVSQVSFNNVSSVHCSGTHSHFNTATAQVGYEVVMDTTIAGVPVTGLQVYVLNNTAVVGQTFTAEIMVNMVITAVANVSLNLESCTPTPTTCSTCL